MIEHCWLRRIAPCSDPETGPGEDMTRQPSSASPDPHLRGELETTSARVHRRKAERRIHEALAGFEFHCPNRDHRAVKAFTIGGLRPAFTALAGAS